MDKEGQQLVIGIDVQLSRGLAYAAMDRGGRVVDCDWLDPVDPFDVAKTVSERFPDAVVGIDAPRAPLSVPRPYYWESNRWRRRRPSDKGLGRHCEVVVSACGLARPQWTPMRHQTPQWMRWGFGLFEGLQRLGIQTEEVFPSASYRMLVHDGKARLSIPLSGFMRGPKDMLDAIVAAFTLGEYLLGRGCSVGGGDGLGTIVLPRPLADARAEAVGNWPAGL